MAIWFLVIRFTNLHRIKKWFVPKVWGGYAVAGTNHVTNPFNGDYLIAIQFKKMGASLWQFQSIHQIANITGIVLLTVIYSYQSFNYQRPEPTRYFIQAILLLWLSHDLDMEITISSNCYSTSQLISEEII